MMEVRKLLVNKFYTLLSKCVSKLSTLDKDLYYKPGDRIKIHYHTTGILTSDRKRIYFTLPLDKPLKGVNNISIENPTAQIRQDGVYLLGSSSTTDGWQWSDNLTIYKDLTSFPMALGIGYDSISEYYFNGTNNEVVGVSLDCYVTFK